MHGPKVLGEGRGVDGGVVSIEVGKFEFRWFALIQSFWCLPSFFAGAFVGSLHIVEDVNGSKLATFTVAERTDHIILFKHVPSE